MLDKKILIIVSAVIIISYIVINISKEEKGNDLVIDLSIIIEKY